MAIRNNHLYNLNEQRSYPLDDTASGLSNDGDRLPNALISDLRLRWPVTYGKYAFLSAVTETALIVTLLIEATDDLDNDPSSSTLIAGLTLPKADLVIGRTYALTTFQPQVGGFTAIGPGEDQLFRGLFSSPRQSLLTARAARSFRAPSVPSIGLEQAAASLDGMVNLTAAAPLQLNKETRVIDGVEQENVIVFRLQEEAREIATGATRDSVFSRFAGPCGRRVGSKSCNDPQPVQTINGITPDCDGVLTLDFRGCATIGRNVSDCGVIIDCSLGLSASCDPAYLPTLDTGELPSEVTPVVVLPPAEPKPPVGVTDSISESVYVVLSLPYCDTFDDGVAYGFNPQDNSLFGFIADDSPGENLCCAGPPGADGYGCSQSESNGDYFLDSDVDSSYGAVADAAQARTNISLFSSDVQTLYRRYTTDAKVTEGLPGSLRNAGIVLNYRLSSTGLPLYFLALLDLENSTFGLYYFNGVILAELSVSVIPGVRTDDWYRLQLEVTPSANLTSLDMTARLDGIDDSSISVTINTNISLSLWDTDSGQAGLYARRSRSYFSFWRVDELNA